MNETFMSDYYRMTGEKYTKNVRALVNIVFRHNIRYMYLYRKYQKHSNLFLKYKLFKLNRKYGLEISLNADIGEGLYLGHPYNITVADGTRIGKNVNLNKGCTIGRENRGSRQGVPTIGDNVYVGINATVVGKIHIGSDVLIAPNAFVNFDVPEHSIVTGNPGVVHAKDDATNSYVNFCV